MHEFALTTLTRGLRWQDAVDVALLTLLFSSAYRWLRRTVAIQVAFGIATLVAGSWIANHLGLILTSYLLSAISAVATIAIVVIFQHEIRSGLNRVSPLRWLSRRRGQAAPQDSRAAIARAAFAVADHRKGGLIVIPRRDSIFEHVTAGTLVEARLSSSLIETIFTSASPLHDGAIVVSDTRLLRAGVVLPLSTETDDPSHGTRHRAAIGLARISDALIICISEERGSVCLVHDDALEAMVDEAQLFEALRRFGAGRRGDLPRTSARGLLRLTGLMPRLAPHLTIFACVVAAWAALALDRSHAIARVVPLEIRGVNDGMVSDPPHYTSIAVELRSSRRELELLAPDAVEAYVDLAGTTLGAHVFRVHTSAPAGIEVASITPASVPLQVRSRTAPVTPTAPVPPPVVTPRIAAVPAVRGRVRPLARP
jgi:diadenylate cyclase